MEIFRLYELKNESGVGIFIPIKDFAKFASKYIIIAVVIYTSLFAIHFAALPNSGKGDVFMTNQFQKTLIGNPNANATNTNIIAEKFPAKFFELNEVMFATNHGMTATHSYSSKWYTWPLMQRTVFYWQDVSTSTDSRHSYIYLLGNPFIYWLSAVSVIFLVVLGAFVLLFKDLVVIDDSKKKKLLFLIVIGYLTNFLPFIFIGRVMFLYHYETALIFAVISIAFFLDLTKGKRKIAVATIIILLAFSAYLYWSPLTYGTPLSDSELAGRMWLPSWR
jgi:dolichyl-phosphate-mannose-protein mannosyltransferase